MGNGILASPGGMVCPVVTWSASRTQSPWFESQTGFTLAAVKIIRVRFYGVILPHLYVVTRYSYGIRVLGGWVTVVSPPEGGGSESGWGLVSGKV
jgi:hypothetical protein